MKHVKRITIVLGVFFIIVLFGAIAGYFWYQEQIKPVSNNTNVSEFIITKGKTAEQVGQDLQKAGFIRNPLAFKLYVQLTDKTQKIQAGRFRLSPSYTMTQVVDSLSKGPVELWVTIPEGLRREEVVEKVITALEMPEAQATIFREEFLAGTKGMEGMLFPDTYLFPRDATADRVISTMKNTFDKRVDAQMRADIAKSAFSLNQIVTLASLLERETKGKSEDERPTVAGILYNRLRRGMPLQVDASVQYALSSERCKSQVSCDWWPTITRSDYEYKHPYSTYTNTGLPPGPIANPGISVLKAAVYPTQTDYLYYIHDKNGTIYYAKTLQEHNQNVQKYLQ